MVLAMDIILPKLDFIYSYIYDSTLAELSGKEYSNKMQAEAERYIKIVSKEFSKYSKRVLLILEYDIMHKLMHQYRSAYLYIFVDLYGQRHR